VFADVPHRHWVFTIPIARCPFSLTRMISLTDEGNIIYRASNPQCVAFPVMGDNDLIAGNPRTMQWT
jgi:hypothetical protein